MSLVLQSIRHTALCKTISVKCKHLQSSVNTCSVIIHLWRGRFASYFLTVQHGQGTQLFLPPSDSPEETGPPQLCSHFISAGQGQESLRMLKWFLAWWEYISGRCCSQWRTVVPTAVCPFLSQVTNDRKWIAVVTCCGDWCLHFTQFLWQVCLL